MDPVSQEFMKWCPAIEGVLFFGADVTIVFRSYEESEEGQGCIKNIIETQNAVLN